MNSHIFVLGYVGVVFSAHPKQQSENIDLAGPTCTPSDAAKNAANWSQCPFGQDYNAWYGLTNEALDYYEAAKQCEMFGAKLVSASDATVDSCAAYTIDLNKAFDQMVLYSGRYLSGVSSWVWCSGDKCNSSFDYVNWDNSSSTEGNCMGGYLQDYSATGSFDEIDGYGWVERDCKEVLVRAMCRLDCDSAVPVTTEQAMTDVTNVETTASAMKTQYLMYSRRESQRIYSYTLEIDQDPVKKGQFIIPYSTRFPGLTFNRQSNVLEIVGDWYSSSNKNHKMMTIAGSFSNALASLFDGDYYFEVAHSERVGTLVFSGDGHNGICEVYIITQNSNWNEIGSSDKYLSPFINTSEEPGSKNNNYRGYGVVEHMDNIYLVGGNDDGYQSTIQFINFEEVENLQEAQTRQWVFMENLKNAVFKPAVIYSNEQLLVVGDTGVSKTTCQDVQFLHIAANTTGVYAGTVDCGMRRSTNGLTHPGMYNIGDNVSIFGGYKAKESCIQQTVSVDDLDSKWECLTASETTLEDLESVNNEFNQKETSSDDIRYSNFFSET